MHLPTIPVVLFAVAAFTGASFAQEFSPEVRAQARAIQVEKASRTPGQRKLDSQLNYLAREASGQPAVAGAPEVKSRVALEPNGQVIVDISAVPSAALRSAIVSVGGTVIYESVRWSSVRASLPPATLEDFALRADVKHIARGAKPTAHTVTNEAAAAEKATIAGAQFGVSGAGIKVGVISDSDDHSETSVNNGELPDFTELPGRSGQPGTGEGTAMAEIVHDIAPSASIYFASASGGKPFFADSILALKAAGCKIIVDDISYGDEWQFQDDEIGQAVNEVVTGGAVYLSASGNEGNLKRHNSTTWEGDFADGGANALLPGGHVHSFGTQNFNRLLESKSGVTLQWSDEYHTSANDYDLYVLNAAGTAIVASSNEEQSGTGTPMEEVDDVKPGERIVIWKADAAAPRYLRLSCTGSPIEVATAGQTIGHAATANCICVASADASVVAPDPFTTASVLDDASSDGPHKMFYLPDGTPVTPGNFLHTGGVTIQAPAITAGDGGQTSVTGFQPFYGTSAAAPAAAAIAALVWERNPSLSNAELRTVLESSCLDIEDPGFDINSGNGILMADLAVANAIAGPEIAVEQPAGTDLASGSSRGFGSVAVGSTSDLIFTIRNVGSASLTGLMTSFTGPDNGDFTVSTAPTAPLAGPSGSTTLTVHFAPTTIGLKTATLHVASNDADEGDFTIDLSGLAPDPASIAQADAVTATTGGTRFHPLDNDANPGDSLYIVSVSDPRITILDDRTLLIPEGFLGSFVYTASDGTTMGDAIVNVLAGTPLATPKYWNGLLYDDSGLIGGAVSLSRLKPGTASKPGTLSGTVTVGTAKANVSFAKFSRSATRNTSLGSVTVTEEDNGRMTVELENGSSFTGSLRPGKVSATKEQLNIALASVEFDVPGGGFATAKQTALGVITITGKLPDGRAFTGKARLADNDSFTFYSVVAGTSPKAFVGGEFTEADLTTTDVTGELEWYLPAQKSGLESDGVYTYLAANGSLFTPKVLPSDGPGTLDIAGGDLDSDSSTATTVTAGKPTFPSLLHSWTVNSTLGTFTLKLNDPARNKTVIGTGIYLPKSRSAWGFFPGSTVGGSVSLKW